MRSIGLRKKLKRIAAVILSVTMLAATAHIPLVHAEGTDAPNFGDRTEDWDYNRIKQLGLDKVYALNHNEYMEYKSFSPIKFRNPGSGNEIYFEFSFPYNCTADIQLYCLTSEEYKQLVMDGKTVDMAEMESYLERLNKNSSNYLGNLVGKTLTEHVIDTGSRYFPKAWPLYYIEEQIKALTYDYADKSCELKNVDIYGKSGKNPQYNSIESYYAARGMEVPANLMMQEEETGEGVNEDTDYQSRK